MKNLILGFIYIFCFFFIVTFCSAGQGTRMAKETGSGALNFSLTRANRTKFVSSVRFKLSSAQVGASTFSVYIDSSDGEAYDYPIYSKDMDGHTVAVYTYERPYRVPNSEDVIRATFTNGGGLTYGFEIEMVNEY